MTVQIIRITMSERHPDWHVEVDHHGVHVVTHWHGDVQATAYLYSNPDEVWAECTMCPARLTIPARSTTAPVGRQQQPFATMAQCLRIGLS